jgi:hypothetical protein
MCYWEQCERSANIISQQEARRFYHEYIQEVSDMNEFSPLNKLESMLLAAKQGRVPVNEFLQQLWSSEIALPTANEVEMDGFGFAPIFFDKEGVSMLAAFTSKDRVGQLAAIAKYCMVMNGGEVLRRMPKGHGLVVNPGLHVGFEISPSGIAEIVSEYG